jgi:hypothetical protein
MTFGLASSRRCKGAVSPQRGVSVASTAGANHDERRPRIDGAIVVKRWEEPFYARVDSFLVEARSVSNVIQSCFGYDKAAVVQGWFKALSPDEQSRRDEFSTHFNADRDRFRNHNLTKMRDAKEHRRGFAPVEGVVIGPSGMPYPASPTAPVPIAESPSIGDDAPLWARTQPAIPVWPSGDEDEFRIDGKPLFPERQAYLQLAHQLRDKARDICQRVHDGKHLTPPPW